METITILGAMSLMPNSREQISLFSNELIAQVKGGHISALKLKAQFKFLEKMMEKVESKIKDEILNDALKYGKSFEAHGFNIEVSENLGVKYDYSHCGDPQWVEYDMLIRAFSEQKKDRELFLRNIKGHVEVPDEATGEMKVVLPPVKTSTTGLKFTAI